MKIYKDNITNRNEEFEKLVLKTQEEMKEYIIGRLGNLGKVKQGDGYVYHKGTFPVLLCAHMDTVHKDRIHTLVYANGTVSSPQGIGGDDRCGIYMIFKILKKFDCHVVFLEDEEIGCVGAKKFVKTKTCKKLKEEGLKYIIEFDRKGNNHAVTYDCDNKEFDNFITKEFFKKEYGTCSDISYIAPALDVAAVNLSCGYYQEHHIEEWVVLNEMEKVIDEAIKVLERTKDLKKPFEYIKGNSYGYNYEYHGRGYGGYGYDDWYDDYNGWNYNNYNYNKRNHTTKDHITNDNATTYDKYTFRYKYNTDDTSVFEKDIYAEDYATAVYKFFSTYKSLRMANVIEVLVKVFS